MEVPSGSMDSFFTAPEIPSEPWRWCPDLVEGCSRAKRAPTMGEQEDPRSQKNE